MKYPVRSSALSIVAFFVVASILGVVAGRLRVGEALSGFLQALVILVGAAWYTDGTRFPGARADGAKGAVAGVFGAIFGSSLLLGLWRAVQRCLDTPHWGALQVLDLVVCLLTYIGACGLAFWCITEVVLRDKARKERALEAKRAAAAGVPDAAGMPGPHESAA